MCRSKIQSKTRLENVRRRRQLGSGDVTTLGSRNSERRIAINVIPRRLRRRFRSGAKSTPTNGRGFNAPRTCGRSTASRWRITSCGYKPKAGRVRSVVPQTRNQRTVRLDPASLLWTTIMRQASCEGYFATRATQGSASFKTTPSTCPPPFSTCGGRSHSAATCSASGAWTSSHCSIAFTSTSCPRACRHFWIRLG